MSDYEQELEKQNDELRWKLAKAETQIKELTEQNKVRPRIVKFLWLTWITN